MIPENAFNEALAKPWPRSRQMVYARSDFAIALAPAAIDATMFW
jgi:hypothetical protein